MQPYLRRDPAETPLAIINDLAKIDKHRHGTFTVVANVFGKFEFDAVRDIASYGASEIYAGTMKDGDLLAKVEVVPAGPQPELHIHVNARVFVAFREKWMLPHPFPSLFREVHDIVDAFAVFP